MKNTRVQGGRRDILKENRGVISSYLDIRHAQYELNRTRPLEAVEWRVMPNSYNVTLEGGLLTVYAEIYRPDDRKNLHEWSGDLCVSLAGRLITCERFTGADLREIKDKIELELRSTVEVIWTAVINDLKHSPGFNATCLEYRPFEHPDGPPPHVKGPMERHRLRWGGIW